MDSLSGIDIFSGIQVLHPRQCHSFSMKQRQSFSHSQQSFQEEPQMVKTQAQN